MARLPYPDRADLPEDVAGLLDKIGAPNVHRMIAGATSAFRPFVMFGNALLFKGTLDPGLREMAIVRVGHLCNASYEIFQHAMIARDVGVDERKIEALANGPDAPVFSELERLVLVFTEELLRDKRGSEASFKALARVLDARQMTELVLAVGYYTMVCMFLETMQIDPESQQKLSGKPRSAAPAT